MGDVDDFVTRLKMFEEPLDGDYFTDAMDYFREEYDPVAFLYVSNDMKWTREHIPNDKGQLSWKLFRIKIQCLLDNMRPDRTNTYDSF